MTTTSHNQPSIQTPRQGSAQFARVDWAARVLVPEMWATVAIVAMWVAVLFVGVYGNDMTFHGVDSSWSTIPSVVAVALFAAIGTASLAKRVFGRKSDQR